MIYVLSVRGIEGVWENSVKPQRTCVTNCHFSLYIIQAPASDGECNNLAHIFGRIIMEYLLMSQ